MNGRPPPTSPGTGSQPGARRRTAFRGAAAFAAGLLWVIVTIIVFFIFHKPLPPEALERLRDGLIDLAAAGWMAWIAVGIGRRFVRPGGLASPERIALCGAFGLGVLGLIGLGMAWAGWLSGVTAVLVCAALTLLVSPPLIGGLLSLRGTRPRMSPPRGAFAILLASFTALSLALSLGIALAPPAAWDALVYHFRYPEQILASHSLSLPASSLLWEMPQLVEMLYAMVIALTGRPETAAALGWGAGLLTLIGLAGTARRWGLRHTLLPAALLLAGDTLARTMGWGYVDWTAALFGFAAWCALSQKDRGAIWILLAGSFAGFAAGTKYTAGIVLAAMVLAVFSVRDGKRFLRDAALLAGGFLLTFWPWPLRGMVFWGNPLPPLLDSGPLTAYAMDFVRRQPLDNAWLAAAAMPFLQSTIGREGGFPFDMTIGPLLLALLPGALVRRREETGSGAFLLKIFWIGALLYWAVTGVGGLLALHLIQPRLYMVLFPGLAMLAAYGFERMWEIRLGAVRLGAVAAVMCALVLTAQAASFLQDWTAAGIPDYLAGSLDRREYLEANLGWYARAMEAVRSLPDGSRVLMLWEPRGLYCGGSCREDTTIDRWYLLMRSGGTADGILAGWKGEGWTHVLFFDAGAEFERASRGEYDPADWEELDRLLARLTVVERFGDGYTLYAVE